MAKRLNLFSVSCFQPGKYPVTPDLSLKFQLQNFSAVAGFALPCNLNPSYMTTKNVRQSTGRPVLVLAVDFRRNSKTQITADVKRQFETCEYFAERHKLSPIDFTIINHQHLLQESNEFKVLLDLLQKLNVKTVLIRKSNRLSMTGFFQEEFSKHEISITWVTVNYDRTQNRNFDQTTVVPMIFRSPRNWDFLN
jgi:hypothetical protein